jgi:hypothetical protein
MKKINKEIVRAVNVGKQRGRFEIFVYVVSINKGRLLIE